MTDTRPATRPVRCNEYALVRQYADPKDNI
jgi:hypothetical protein